MEQNLREFEEEIQGLDLDELQDMREMLEAEDPSPEIEIKIFMLDNMAESLQTFPQERVQEEQEEPEIRLSPIHSEEEEEEKDVIQPAQIQPDQLQIKPYQTYPMDFDFLENMSERKYNEYMEDIEQETRRFVEQMDSEEQLQPHDGEEYTHQWGVHRFKLSTFFIDLWKTHINSAPFKFILSKKMDWTEFQRYIQVNRELNISNWKYYLHDLFRVSENPRQIEITLKDLSSEQNNISEVIIPNLERRQLTTDIYEIRIPGFPFVNFKNNQEVQLKEKLRQIYRETNQNHLLFQPMETDFQNNENLWVRQLQSNFEKLQKLLRYLIDLTGRRGRWDRIWISFELTGVSTQDEDELVTKGKSIGLAYGSYPEYKFAPNVSEDEKTRQRDQYKQQFLSSLWRKMSVDMFEYDFYPLYIENIQVFVSDNRPEQIKNEKIKYNNKNSINGEQIVNQKVSFNELMEFIQEVAIFDKRSQNCRNAAFKKQVQDIDNLYGVCHQRKEEPCLFTLIRYHKKIDVQWSQYRKIMKNKILKKYIIKGEFTKVLKLLYKERYLNNFGIYFYNSQRWVNQEEEVQYILLDNHIIISNRDKVEQLIYTKLRQKDQQFILNTWINNKPKKGKKKEFLECYYDIETFTSKNQISEGYQTPYLLCVFIPSLQSKKKFKNFWGMKCLDKMINWLHKMSELYDIIKIWSFNGAKFDNIYLWKRMKQLKIPVKMYGTPNNIKRMDYNNIKFFDLRLIFNTGSLKKQAKQWKINDDKLDLDVAGKSRKWYELSKKYVILYCQKDCVVLQKLVEKFYSMCEQIQYNGQKLRYDNIFTASQLSLEIFKQLYNKFQVLGTTNRRIYQEEKRTFFGGMCCNYVKFAENVYYYDINSSYPHVMKNGIFPINFMSQGVYDPSEKVVDYYLYEVELQFKDDIQVPFIPQRGEDGLYYCLNIKRSWRWGIDINTGQKYNMFKYCKIFNVIKYIGMKIFEEFVTDVNEKKIQAKVDGREDLAAFNKLVANSLYGKTGQKQRNEVKYCRKQDLPLYLNKFEIPIMKNKQRKFINKNPELLMKEVSALRQIDEDLYQIEYLESLHLNDIHSLNRIAALITRMGACHLMDGMQSVGLKHVKYCDTDSTFLDEPMDDDMLHPTELGKWKNEMKTKENPTGLIEKAYFGAPKMYYLQINKEKRQFSFRNKGVVKDFWWIDQGIKKMINSDSPDSMEDIEQIMYNMIIKQQSVNVINPNQFTKTKGVGEIYVIPVEKSIQIQNKKREWYGPNNILSRPLKDMPN